MYKPQSFKSIFGHFPILCMDGIEAIEEPFSLFIGSFLESKDMRAIFQKKGKKGQDI